MPHSQGSILERYAVSLKNGFLPATAPVQKLEDPYYSPWEKIAGNLPQCIQNGSIRSAVDDLPILSTANLNGEQEWRRAYVVLAYLTHAYIWGGEQPKEVSQFRQIHLIYSQSTDPAPMHLATVPGSLRSSGAPTLRHLRGRLLVEFQHQA